jgi:hypothetical protein
MPGGEGVPEAAALPNARPCDTGHIARRLLALRSASKRPSGEVMSAPRATGGEADMADEPLDRRILREIRDRLKQSRAAVEEYQRLEAALKALDESTGGSRRVAQPRRSSGAAASSGKRRAPRGANRDAALQVIADRPGITVAELSSVTGIPKNVLYSLTRGLTQRGRIERVSLPGDTFGFRIPELAADAGANADGDGGAEPEAPKRARRSRRQPAAEAEPAAEEPAATDGDPADEAASEDGEPATNAASA